MTDNDSSIVEPDRRQKPPPPYDAPGPQMMRADTVRSGPLGRPVLAVLIASLASAFLLLIVYWAFWSSTVP